MINPSLLPGPPVTFQSLAPAAAPAPAPRSPVSLGTNMEELLKGIPPNVSIPTNADQPPGEFILEWLMQLLPRGLFSIKSQEYYFYDSAHFSELHNSQHIISLLSGVSAVRLSTLERQLSSPGIPGTSRHLSGDQGLAFRGQGPGRHLSGDQVNQVRLR